MTCDVTIDVSHHQGHVEWSKVFDEGKRVAIVKATQGGDGVDKMFDRYRRDASDAGLLVLPYHFMTDDSADEQAQHFLNVTGLTAGEAAALDWEGDGTATAAEVEICGIAVASVIGRDPLGYWASARPARRQPQC